MKELTKIYLKLFLSYGLIFGFLMSLWDYINKGEISFLNIVLDIIFFGGFMSWISVKSMKKSKQKFGGTELTEEDFNASQSMIIKKNKSIKELYHLLKLNEVTKNWKMKIEEMKIFGKTKISWTSFGERIIITELNDTIKIESKPVMSTILFDNGKNKENVLLIKELVEE